MAASLQRLLERYRSGVDTRRTRGPSRRITSWLVLAAAVGAGTGLAVVAFQYVVLDLMWERILRGPFWVVYFTPALGLALAAAVVQLTRSGSDTAEDYIRVYHDRRARLHLRALPAKLLAGILTVGSGGSMGLEGPSLFIGGTLGDATQRRVPAFFSRDESKVLLVAGAAAGIAAVFKAPLTGLVFAMEVPYLDDVARHVLGTALVASASGYLVEVALRGVGPLVPIAGAPSFRLADIGLALVVGLVAGLSGRVIIATYRFTRARLRRLRSSTKVAVAGAVLALVGVLSHWWFGEPLALGPGEEAIRAATIGGLSVGALFGLLSLKLVATSFTASAGGVGGLFFPLVVMGTALGALFQHLSSGAHATLFPLVGMASLLGSAYHTPLAGVSFVAEATGRAGFVVPTFVATAVAYAAIGRVSISGRQRFRRAGPVERMLDVSVTAVLADDAAVPMDEDLDSFVARALRARHKTFAAVEADGTYVGAVEFDRVAEIPRDRWADTRVRDVVDRSYPRAESDWTVRAALEAMAAADVDHLPVVTGVGRLLGVATTSAVFRVGEVLDRLREEERGAAPKSGSSGRGEAPRK